MRWAVLAIGCTIGAIVAGVLFLDFAILGDEEVVTLSTRGSEGNDYETQLWVVDGPAVGENDGAVWLRAHSADAEWLARLRAKPEVELERDGRSIPYRASVAPGRLDAVNRAMAAKYGTADRVICWLFPPGRSVAVRLEPDPTRKVHRLEAAHGAAP